MITPKVVVIHLAVGSEGGVKTAISIVTTQEGKIGARNERPPAKTIFSLLSMARVLARSAPPDQSLWSPCRRYRKWYRGCRQYCNAPGRSRRRTVIVHRGVPPHDDPPMAVDGDAVSHISVPAKVCGHHAVGAEGGVEAAVSIVTCQGKVV